MNQKPQKMISSKFRRAILLPVLLSPSDWKQPYAQSREKKRIQIMYWVNQEKESIIKATYVLFFLMCPLSMTVMTSVEATSLKIGTYSTQRSNPFRMFTPS